MRDAGAAAMAPRGLSVAGAIIVSLMSGTPAIAQEYWVNNANSSCSDAGPGTISQPYCTISAALSAHHQPGTTIRVLPGTYHEQVTVPASGTSAGSISIMADNADGPVVVDGADDFGRTALWQPASGSVWLAASVTWKPLQVFADDARLADSLGATPVTLPAGCFLWVAGQGLYVNVGGDNPGNHRLGVGHRASCFYIAGLSWIFVDGFTATRSEDQAIRLLEGCSNVVVIHNTVSFAGTWGILADGCTGVRIGSNIVTDNAFHGIGLTGGTTQTVVEDNESARNVYPLLREANGLYCFDASSNLIQRNRFHDNQDTGEQFSPGSDDNISLQNLSWHNGDHGYDNLDVTGNVHIGDVAWGNHKDGFSIEGQSPGQMLYDCIATDNGLTTNEFDLWVDSNSSVGFTSNDNLFWNSTSQPPVKYITTLYSSVAAYSAASGQDTRTIQADPRFANPAAGDFHLLAGSPAIDSGNSGVPDWPSLDAEGTPRLDDPGTPNAGLGPIAYADRGALEFRPEATAVGPAASGVPAVRIVPNPTRGRALLSFTAARPGLVTVLVFDMEGRLVRTLAANTPSIAGENVLAFDGRADNGSQLHDGVYFYRVLSPNGAASGRFVVLH